MVIELDGPIHQDSEEYDRFRDFEMKEKGIYVLRLKIEDLLNHNEVLQKINDILDLIS
jgi:very-short-patch-repair endonuclease